MKKSSSSSSSYMNGLCGLHPLASSLCQSGNLLLYLYVRTCIFSSEPGMDVVGINSLVVSNLMSSFCSFLLLMLNLNASFLVSFLFLLLIRSMSFLVAFLG